MSGNPSVRNIKSPPEFILFIMFFFSLEKKHKRMEQLNNRQQIAENTITARRYNDIWTYIRIARATNILVFFKVSTYRWSLSLLSSLVKIILDGSQSKAIVERSNLAN